MSFTVHRKTCFRQFLVLILAAGFGPAVGISEQRFKSTNKKQHNEVTKVSYTINEQKQRTKMRKILSYSSNASMSAAFTITDRN